MKVGKKYAQYIIVANSFPNGTTLLPNQYTAKKSANVQIARCEKCEL